MKALRSILLLLAMATPVAAASATDFYLTLLRRGTADVDAGRFAEATPSLRLAAFGLLDSIEHYEIAQAYLAVAFDRLGQIDQARDAAQRIVAAEKVERKFRTIALPAAIRTAFEAVAKKVLSAADAAALSGGATAKPSEPVVVDRVDVITERAPETAHPQPSAAAPAQPQPEAPAQTTTRPPATARQSSTAQTAPRPQTSTPQDPPAQNPPPQNPPPQTTTAPQTTARQQASTPQTTRPQTPQSAQPRTVDVGAQFAAAERALNAANVAEARRVYRELLAVQTLDRASVIRLAEGFYRSRDFANALAAFERAGGLRAGEEPYRYYIAVAAYEVGQYDRAKRELAAALPYIELTPDVRRYRAKIEAAQ